MVASFFPSAPSSYAEADWVPSQVFLWFQECWNRTGAVWSVQLNFSSQFDLSGFQKAFVRVEGREQEEFLSTAEQDHSQKEFSHLWRILDDEGIGSALFPGVLGCIGPWEPPLFHERLITVHQEENLTGEVGVGEKSHY